MEAGISEKRAMTPVQVCAGRHSEWEIVVTGNEAMFFFFEGMNGFYFE